MLQRLKPSAKCFRERAINTRDANQVYKDPKKDQLSISTAIRSNPFKARVWRSLTDRKYRAGDNQDHAILSANVVTSGRRYQAESTAQNPDVVEEIGIHLLLFTKYRKNCTQARCAYREITQFTQEQHKIAAQSNLERPGLALFAKAHPYRISLPGNKLNEIQDNLMSFLVCRRSTRAS